MIPVRLNLKNFMSYEDPPPLDFTAFQMACICGNNGHGKSAVIDAITWALWGEGRKASIEKKPDEGLLKIGKTEMMVEFTFDMEGDRYRVIRQYSKSGKTAKTILEFEVFSSEKGEFTNLTQKNMSQTQEKIIEHLRMGYETFINSSVILQGRADEFAIKKASERKQLLCDILGLSKYDELSMLAREKYKESNIRMEFVEEEKNRLEKELLEKENVEERLKNIKDDLQNLNKEIDNTEKELIVMREKKSTLSAIMNQIEGIEKQIVREESSIKDMKKQKIQLQEEMKLTEKILQEEEVILKNHNLYEELIKQDALMYEKNKKITSLKQKKMSTESKINQGKNELSSEINVIKEKINSIKVQLKETLKVIDLKEDIEDGFNKLKALENQEKEIEKKFKLQKNLEDLRIKLEKSISEKEGGLKIELATLHKREEEYDIQILKKENIIKQIETLKEEINHMETLEKEKERVILKGTEEQSKTTRMKEQIKEIEKKLEEERQKWMNISKSKDSNCPLCDAPFDEKRKKQTLGKIKKEGEAKKEEINRLVKEIETSKKETHSIKEEYKRLEGEIKKLHPKKSILAQKQVELENCNKASLLKEEIKAKMQKINKILEEKHYAGEEIKKQKEIEEKLILLDYSEEKVQNIKGEKEKWDKYRQEK
ncbi:MAG TPA: AAA family ATPase, partial [Candidatus Eremiobacteraeota bacterium]|nr:AAA family ATPase [Candidatus Eremiobacteraeota bacterium]